MKMVRTLKAGFCWLLALTLSLGLCLCAQAESGTIFPWLDYTMDVTLCTADPEVVDFTDTPSGGVMVMVKLAPVSGTVKTEDITTRESDFSFRDGDGDEYAVHTWRLRGITFDVVTGEFGTKDEQDSFELLFFLQGKDAAAIEGAKLLVSGENDGERIVVPLDLAPRELPTEGEEETPAEPADEATPAQTAEPTAEPTADGTTDENAKDVPHSDFSFVLGGIRYTIAALDDTPDFLMPNQMDGKAGHLVTFSYAESGEEAETANDQLYENARLREPGGDSVRAYCNTDNIGNPYELYFGLSNNVLLQDCVFTIQSDEGPVEIPLATLFSSSDSTKGL